MMETELARRMIEWADQHGLPSEHEMRLKARHFEEASKGYFATVQTVKPPQLLKAWLAARRVWSAHTGEPIFS